VSAQCRTAVASRGISLLGALASNCSSHRVDELKNNQQSDDCEDRMLANELQHGTRHINTPEPFSQLARAC
jgi:hypothetical protein